MLPELLDSWAVVGMWIHHLASCLGRRHLVAKSSSRMKCPVACFPHQRMAQQIEANSGQEDPGCLAHWCGRRSWSLALSCPTELSNFQGVNGEKIVHGCVSNKRLNSASVPQGQGLGFSSDPPVNIWFYTVISNSREPPCTGANKYWSKFRNFIRTSVCRGVGLCLG